jgi:hypothetical protein
MKSAPLTRLENKIVKPGFEKHLKPLVMYRGNVTLGQAHRMWNLMVSAMEQDCSFTDITQRFQHNPEFSHLCGPEKVKQGTPLKGWVGRLLDNPKVLAEEPHLADYLAGLIPAYKSYPTPSRVSEITYRSRNIGAGGWRILGKRPEDWKTGGNIKAKTKELVYPFLIHDGGKPEHDLVRRVNAAVPKYLDPDTRADICQDIMVGILCGDFDPDNLKLPAKEMTKRVQQMFPTKYGPLSLDAIL